MKRTIDFLKGGLGLLAILVMAAGLAVLFGSLGEDQRSDEELSPIPTTVAAATVDVSLKIEPELLALAELEEQQLGQGRQQAAEDIFFDEQDRIRVIIELDTDVITVQPSWTVGKPIGEQEAAQLIIAYGAEIISENELSNHITAYVPLPQIKALARDNAITHIWIDRIMLQKIPYVTPDPPAQLESLSQYDPNEHIGADQLWNRNYTGQGLKIAFVDTGFDTNHPAFSNVTAAAVDVQDSERDGGVTVTLDPFDPIGWPPIMSGNLNDPNDYEGHGTMMASLIAADGDSRMGVAHDSELLGIKIRFLFNTLGETQFTSDTYNLQLPSMYFPNRLYIDDGYPSGTDSDYDDEGALDIILTWDDDPVHWLSGLDVARALLLVGQVLNALMVLSAYLLAREMSRDRATGLVAALVVGVFSPMPAYYASWGRYTHLTGLLILPAAITLTRRALLSDSPGERPIADRDGNEKRDLVLATVAFGGLIFTHYRIAAFYGCFLLAYLVGQRYGRSSRWQHLAKDALRLVVIGGGAMALTLPWLVPTLTTLWLPKLQAWGNAEPSAYFDFSWAYLTPGSGRYVLALALVGLAWALFRRQRFALTLTIWASLLFLLASPALVGLPGGGLVNFVSVEISLFLPLSILVGYAVSQLLALFQMILPMRWRTLYRGTFILLVVASALYGAQTILPILNPSTVLYRQTDEAAMTWIRENTPDDARFLVNPMPWSAYMYAGYDGGYWISPLAGRQTIPPPVLYGLGSTDDVNAINEICAAVIEQGQDPNALWPLLRKWDISHVYIGARGGVLSAKALRESKFYRPVYSSDGTWVFEVLP